MGAALQDQSVSGWRGIGITPGADSPASSDALRHRTEPVVRPATRPRTRRRRPSGPSGHVDLTRLTNAKAQAQIDDAQARFLAALGTAPTTFAYPFGAFNVKIVGFVRAAGFHMAVTTARGAAESWDARLQVPRIEVGPSLSPDDVLKTVAPFG